MVQNSISTLELNTIVTNLGSLFVKDSRFKHIFDIYNRCRIPAHRQQHYPDHSYIRLDPVELNRLIAIEIFKLMKINNIPVKIHLDLREHTDDILHYFDQLLA